MIWILMSLLMAVGIAIAVVPLVVTMNIQSRHEEREARASRPVLSSEELEFDESAEDVLFLSSLTDERVSR